MCSRTSITQETNSLYYITVLNTYNGFCFHGGTLIKFFWGQTTETFYGHFMQNKKCNRIYSKDWATKGSPKNQASSANLNSGGLGTFFPEHYSSSHRSPCLLVSLSLCSKFQIPERSWLPYHKVTISALIIYSSCSGSVGQRPVTSMSPENLWDVQMREPHPRTYWKRNFRAGSPDLCFNKSPSQFWHTNVSEPLIYSKDYKIVWLRCDHSGPSPVWESSWRGNRAVNLAATPKRCQGKLVNLSGS